MALLSATVRPFSSLSTGTVPAGFSARNSSRRSHTFSSRSSKGMRFSARARRTFPRIGRERQVVEDSHGIRYAIGGCGREYGQAKTVAGPTGPSARGCPAGQSAPPAPAA